MMRHFMKGWLLVFGAAVIMVSMDLPLSAQSKPAPRLANGKPDFTGVWDHPRVSDLSADATGCVGGTPGCSSKGNGPISMTPLGESENKKEKFDYGMHCLPWGYVRSTQTPYPHEYSHTPNKLVIMW